MMLKDLSPKKDYPWMVMVLVVILGEFEGLQGSVELQPQRPEEWISWLDLVLGWECAAK